MPGPRRRELDLSLAPAGTARARRAITMSRHIAAQERMYEMIGELRVTGHSTMPPL